MYLQRENERGLSESVFSGKQAYCELDRRVKINKKEKEEGGRKLTLDTNTGFFEFSGCCHLKYWCRTFRAENACLLPGGAEIDDVPIIDSVSYALSQAALSRFRRKRENGVGHKILV